MATIERGIARIARRQSLYGVILVILVSLVGSVLTAQGWRSRLLTFDLVPALRAAHDLVATGALPEHSDVGSYGSFAPPGPAWLMVPSTLLFDDPRLSQYVGAGLLHFLTLLGVFLLGRKYFGTTCGCVAVVLYGLSAHGLWWAGSLWSFGSPDMFIWLVFLASEWVTRRDGRFLAAAVVAWAFGMYVDLSLAPAFAVLPAIWLVYRPPVTLKPLLAAAALLVIVWFPYLRLESRRDFVDVRSQFRLQHILPSDTSRSWCDPARKLKAWSVNAPTTAPTVTAARGSAPVPMERALAAAARPTESSVARVTNRLEDAFRDRLLGNFLVTKLPGRTAIGVALLLTVLASLVLLSVTGSAPRSQDPGETRERSQKGMWRAEARSMTRVAVAAVVLALGAWVFRHLVFDAALVRGAMAVFLLAGFALIFPQITAIVDRLLKRAGVHIQSEEEMRRRRVLVLALAVPWLLLFAAVERGISIRFLWLWPLQVILIAAFFAVLLPRLGVPRPVIWVAQALVIFAVFWNSFLVSRVDSWRADGWSGHDATAVRVVDYIASDIKKERQHRSAIGYQLFIYPFMADYNIMSPEYKVGAEYDVLFRYGHGIQNTDTCAEGVSPRDDYRIVQTRPDKEADAPRNYFDVPLGNRFELVRKIGPYRVLKVKGKERS